jgi:hypothetical protein
MDKLRLAATCCLLLIAISAAGGSPYDLFDVYFAWTPGVRNHVTPNPGDQPLVVQRIEPTDRRWSLAGTGVPGLRLAPREHCSIDAKLVEAPPSNENRHLTVEVHINLRPHPYIVPFQDGPMFSGALAPAFLVKHFRASGLAMRPVPAHQDAVEYIVRAEPLTH